MAVNLSNGSVLAIATAYASPINVTAASTAAECVISVVNTFAAGDFVEFTSGWSNANGRVFRVKTPTGTTVVLEELDTLDPVRFPPGSGLGSVRKINTWTQIQQIIDLTSSGGEPQFTTFSFLEQDFETQIPTSTSPQSLNISIGDDPSLLGYKALKTVASTRKATALKLNLPSGSLLLYNGIFSFDETPTLTKNQVMACRSGVALQGRPVRYAS